MNTLLPSIALVDDHVLMRNGLASLIHGFGEYNVLFQADNGEDLIRHLGLGSVPDMVLLDIQMPGMDGYATAGWLKEHHPDLKILALSMYDNDNAIIRMLRQGARGYVLKDIEPTELREALHALHTRGFYYSESVTGRLVSTVNQPAVEELNEREREFLQWACTEMTYKEIAGEMNLSPRTVDGYRDDLFEKFHLRSRVGLVLYAIKNGIVRV